MRTSRQVALALVCCGAVVTVVLAFLSMQYAAGRLEVLRNDEKFPSAETAMQHLMDAAYPGARVEIVGSGLDGPGLRYVVARVSPPNPGGSAVHDPIEQGCYFLRTEHGWVHFAADEFSGPTVAVGKVLLDRLAPGRRGSPSGSGSGR